MDKKRKKTFFFDFFYNSRWTYANGLAIICALFAVNPSTYGQKQDNHKIVDSAEESEPSRFAAKVKIESNTRPTLSPAADKVRILRDENIVLRQRLGNLHEENKFLAKENQRLGQQMEGILKNNKELESKLRKLQFSIASVLTEGKHSDVSEREEKLLYALDTLRTSGKNLAVKTTEFYRYLKSVLLKMKLERLEEARLKLRLEELMEECRNVSRLTEIPEAEGKITDKCRIYSINNDLKIVVLSVGTAHGVCCGLNLWTGKDRNAVLQVIAVKPQISAAMLIKGNWQELAPGMAAYLTRKQQNNNK
jgi:septal ring factor EnvC (AmiA/AmiB activator)